MEELAIPKYFFDKRDYALLRIVNDVLAGDKSLKGLKKLLAPSLHPHGIKEMAASQGLRIAYAVIRLLGSLEKGFADDRLVALRSLRDEVLYSARSMLRRNTARVLLQIMKELVRTRGDTLRQLELAHDFRVAISGKPRIIRREMRRYHLIEMPEDWSQIAFDDHVHDANTKGRKSPTHLIMDAWIKGIRYLTVVYYNYVQPEVVQELLDSAAIMGVRVRIGIEFSARFRDRYVKLIWEPRGFSEAQEFLRFLSEPAVKELLGESRMVSEYQQLYVFRVLDAFNETHRQTINNAYGIELSPLDFREFIAFVGTGQPSLLHLGKFILNHLLPHLGRRVEELRPIHARSEGAAREAVEGLVAEMNSLDPETIIFRFLEPRRNPQIHDPSVPTGGPEAPEILRLTPFELLTRLAKLRAGSRVTLYLYNLCVEDVTELLYDCRGMITHLEIFNLKLYTKSPASYDAEIVKLQQDINDGNIIRLKSFIRELIERVETTACADSPDRKSKLREILHNIAQMISFYRASPLKSRIGTGSTGSTGSIYGMGLVVLKSLPGREQRRLNRQRRGPTSRKRIPVSSRSFPRTTRVPFAPTTALGAFLARTARRFPLIEGLLSLKRRDWVVEGYAPHKGPVGNIVTLGGIMGASDNGLRITPEPESSPHRTPSLRYLNTGFKNTLKLLLGFVPAFLTFLLTKDWWLLAYGGAFLWFGITGVRNIIQSVLGGGGLRRSPLLRWNDYVSWERMCDSLMYTGFSVPLLDYLVKTLLLDRGLGVTTATNPLLLYTVMALVNGVYLTSHNLFRGLPRPAALGNFFRTVLSIPLAVAFNWVGFGLLEIGGTPFDDINDILEEWAAIISKLASDCVAGVIEGFADRGRNLRMRLADYHSKLAQLFQTYAQMEVLFPETDLLKLLESPEEFLDAVSEEGRDLEKVIIVHVLDLLYFWMYQPHARTVLRRLLSTMPQEERRIMLISQYILQREREISQLFVDGIVGKNFGRALSFYLDNTKDYLDGIQIISHQEGIAPGQPLPIGNGCSGSSRINAA